MGRCDWPVALLSAGDGGVVSRPHVEGVYDATTSQAVG